MAGDRWTRQFRDRNLSSPAQKARAAALFIRFEILVYAVILLVISIFILRVLL